MKQNKHSLIGKILCLLGFHKMKATRNSIKTKTQDITRIYERCDRCELWGKILYFKDNNKANENT